MLIKILEFKNPFELKNNLTISSLTFEHAAIIQPRANFLKL